MSCERLGMLRWLKGCPMIVELDTLCELDQVEVAVVVEDHAGGAGAADRLDVSLDVDQSRAGEIRAERLAQGGQKIGVVERERPAERFDRVCSVGSTGHECRALIDAPECRAWLRRNGRFSLTGV